MWYDKPMVNTDNIGQRELPEGAVLQGKFRVEKTLGAGGYGVTYLVRHVDLPTRRAIKEFFPGFAVRDRATQELQPVSGSVTVGDFRRGIQQFFGEAERLAAFEHKNIVRVHDVFQENNTAYMVMDYEQGKTLGALLKECGALPESTLLAILAPLLDGLKALHDGGILHRDIAPDNIFIRKDGAPVLLDFGSAREAGGGQSKSVSAIVKYGYSPPEQYISKGGNVRQGPFTDIYALSATLYHAMTGQQPEDSTTRLTNIHHEGESADLILLDSVEGYSPEFINAVREGLAIKADDRPENIDEWRGMFPWPPQQQPQQSKSDSGWSGWKIAAALVGAAAVGAAATYAATSKDAKADDKEEDGEEN